MKTKSFIEVLEEQIRLDLRKEIEAEVRAELSRNTEAAPLKAKPISGAERIETWLSARLQQFSFHPRATGYPKKPSPAKEPHVRQAPPSKMDRVIEKEVIRKRAESFETICAMELLKRHSGGKLPESFSESELKSAWRHAALKTHPDRHIGEDHVIQARASALFRELQLAYTILSELFHDESRTTSKNAA